MFVSDDLENLVNYRSFHRLSGDQYREAHFSAYQDLMNLMLAQTEEDNKLNQLPPSWTRFSGPCKSNLESKAELKNIEDKLHIQWCVIKASKRALDRILGAETSPSPASTKTGPMLLPDRTRTVDPFNSPGTSTSPRKAGQEAVDNVPRTNQFHFQTTQKLSRKFRREF